MRHRFFFLIASLMVALAGCAGPAATPAPSPPPQPVAQPEAPPPPQEAAKDARLLQPDPTGHYIADVDKRLRIVDFAGQVVSAPELADANPVQLVVWAPRGDALIATTGRPNRECCQLVIDARYWLVPVPGGAPRELTGLPPEVVFTWAGDEQSLYVLDNWRRNAPLTELGERIQRYDLATGQLTQLLGRTSRITSVAELPRGDLLVGQYGGGGHGFYYRLPAGQTELVTAAPFHMNLSPDRRWAVEANLQSLPELAVADVTTGAVTHIAPGTPWGPMPRVSDPVWAPDSRWLLYSVSGEVRFFDRTQAEPERVVPAVAGSWLPGPGLQALVFRQVDGRVQPWRYDVAAGKLTGTVGPEAPASWSTAPGECLAVSQTLISADGRTAAYKTCDQGSWRFWYVDLTGQVPPLDQPATLNTRLLALSADGMTTALAEGDPQALRLVALQAR